MSEETYTLKQVAHMLSATGEEPELSQIMRQVRHWTACDLLEPVGDKHGGTGVHRRYTMDQVRRAGVLAEFHHYGVPTTALENFAEVMDDYCLEEDWRLAVEAREPIFLTFSWSASGMTTWQLHTADGPNFVQSNPPNWERVLRRPYHFSVRSSVIILNLTIIFARLTAPKMTDEDMKPLDFRPAVSDD